MIRLKYNTVTQMKMNDDAANPFVAGLNGTPTELISDPYFDLPPETRWTFGIGWLFFEDVAIFISPSGTLDENTFVPIAGHKYLLVYSIMSFDAGVLYATIGGTAGVSRTSPGVFSEVITASDTTGLKFAVTGANGTLDNIFCIDLTLFPNTGVFMDATSPWTNAHSVAGKIGKALSLDGSNYIEVFDQDSCQFPLDTNSFSVWIWFKRNTTGVTEYFFDKRDGTNDGWTFFINSVNRLWAFVQSSGIIYNVATITDTNWHLTSLVVNRTGNATIYLDNIVGALTDVSNQPMNVSNNLIIGANYSGGNNFHGLLDAGGIVNKALSAEERAFIWNSGRGTERLWGYEYGPVGRGIARGIMRGIR